MPSWLLGIAAVALVVILVVQMIRGDAVVCANGAILAKNCTVLHRDAIVAFNRKEGWPKGWEKYEEGAGRLIVGVGRHEKTEYNQSIPELDVGETGGTRTHRLSTEEMPEHSHQYEFSTGYDSPRHTDSSPDEFGDHDTFEETSRSGGNSPHNNMPPYIALHFCRPTGEGSD